MATIYCKVFGFDAISQTNSTKQIFLDQMAQSDFHKLICTKPIANKNLAQNNLHKSFYMKHFAESTFHETKTRKQIAKRKSGRLKMKIL